MDFGQQYNLIINNIFIDLKICRILYVIITNGEFITAVASISISKESNLIDLRVLSNNYNKNNVVGMAGNLLVVNIVIAAMLELRTERKSVKICA